MQFKATINNQPYMLDYATNGGNQVCHVAIHSADGTDHTDTCDYQLLGQAWELAQQHHTRTQAAQVLA